jgi:phosphoglycolate phosphatase
MDGFVFRNLIFDWSGTLVDDLGPVIEATNAVLGRYGLAPLDREAFRRRFRLPYREFYAEVLPQVPLEELESHFRPAFDAAQTPVTILPHAREKLDWCAAAGIRTFVLTSMDQTAFERQLDGFGLRGFFEATYAGVLDKREVIHRILDGHALDPGETAFVGDMTHDVETARHGGVSSIAVLTGYNHPELLASVRPDLTVPDLGVLREVLGRPLRKTRPVATVGALVHDGRGRVLMVRTHKWSGKWGIPGGKIRRGESSTDALRREVLEETGLTIDDIRFAIVQDSIDSPEFMRPEHFILLNYTARTPGGVVRLNDEAEEFRWVTTAEALDLDLNQPTRRLIEEALDLDLIPHADAR